MYSHTRPVEIRSASQGSGQSMVTQTETVGGNKYFEQTSLHGWQYLSSEKWYINKIYWWIICLGSIAASTLLLVFNVNQYANSSTITSINSKTAPLNDVTFPGLIICNVNQVTISFMRSVDIGKDDFGEGTLIFREFMTGEEGNRTEENQKSFNETQKKMVEKYGWNEAKPFWEISSHNCSNMVLKATWKSKYEVKFYDAYKSSTDYGACCLITPFLDFENPETKDVHPSNYTGTDFINTPRGVTRNGIENGLKVILDVEDYEYAYSSFDGNGFLAEVGDARDKAYINQNGFYIAPGKKVLIFF